MSGKKWYESIKKGGILIDFNGTIRRVLGVFEGQLIFDSLTGIDIDSLSLDMMRPITAQEWWQLAPFQDMKTATENTELLLLDNDGFIVPIDRISKGRVECHGDELPLSNFKGWLPLHQSKINA